MRVKKKVNCGGVVELELVKVKGTLYNVYKVKGDKTIFLYRENYTRQQLQEIKRRKFIIDEEEFV